MHLYRDPNGRYYFRYALPRSLIQKLASHKHREVRLSLFTYHRWQAAELAQAYWLACREILKNPENFNFSTVDELKTHIRNAAMAHSPDQYTTLIAFTGTADTNRLTDAVKLLLAYNADFFVLTPEGIRGTLRKRVWTMNGASWDWELIAHLNGQTFPHLKIQTSLVQDAITRELGVMEPETLTYIYQGEERLLRLATKLVYGFHQLFVKSDLQPSIVATIRQLSQAPIRKLAPAPEPIPDSKLLSVMIKEYCDLKTTVVGTNTRNKAWRPGTLKGNLAKLNFYMEVVSDKPVLAISNDDTVAYRNALIRKPKNQKKNPKLKNKTIHEILSMDGQYEVIDEATVKNNHIAVVALFRWMKGNGGDEAPYPTVNMSIEHAFKAIKGRRSKPKDPDEDRQPFDPDQLKLMFESDTSINYLLKTAKYGYQRWLLPLAIYSGARLGELCQLYLHDIGTKDGIHFIEFNEKEQEKSIKNATSIRQISIHPTLIDLGFLDFVAHVRGMHARKTQGRLFYDLTYAELTGYRRNASRWLNERYFEVIGITDERYDWHSFRHTVIGQLERADHIARWRTCCYTGHKVKHMSEAERSYMKRKTLADMLPVIEAIKYDIDWTAYRSVLSMP